MKDLASLHLDNHDSRLKYYHLFMTMPAETEIPHYDLPAGYSFTTYTPGDRDTWIKIEKSAKEFSTFEEGVDAWQRYYGKHEDILPDRMFFIVDPNGKKVATATAFFDEKLPGGWLHWVSVRRDAQGKGLSAAPIAGARLQRAVRAHPDHHVGRRKAVPRFRLPPRAGEFGRKSFRLAHAENADRPPGIKRAGTR